MLLDKLVPFRHDRSAVRILCFPHAGGNAAFYLPLRRLIPPGIDFCPVELPGRGARIEEPPICSMGELIEDICQTLRPLLEVPFACFGHSAGAVIAYEAARRLRSNDGRSATHVFVSAHAPSGDTHSARPLHELSDAALTMALHRFGATPQAVLSRPDLMELILPALRADLEICETFTPSTASIPCPLTVFGGTDDALGWTALDDWRRFTTGSFRLRLFAGGHFYFTTSPTDVIREIVADLKPLLRPSVQAE
jgi:surfactin synthase thioesterase subunit